MLTVMGICTMSGRNTNAQTLISTAFGEFSNSSVQVIFMSGESVSGDFSSGSLSFNSGFISSLDGILTSKETENLELPDKIELSQNYPNPFNPSTKIQFSLPKSSRVKLEVYNSIGAKVAVLLDEDRPAGFHSATFNAGSFASGMYFYTLTADGKNIMTKKMILIK